MNKNFNQIILIFFVVSNIYAQGKFITIWDTRLPGVTGESEVEYIFAQHEDWGSYKHSKFKVNWEHLEKPALNGTIELKPQNRIIKFPEPGIYKIVYNVTPLNKDVLKDKGEYSIERYAPKDVSNFSVYEMKNINDDAAKLIGLVSWGEVKLSGGCLFMNCVNLDVSATDFPYKFCRMRTGMFYNCKKLKGNNSFNYWNLDEELDYMFYNCENFNVPLDRWDVSNVKKMEYMFYGAKSFNQDISNWDVSNAYTLASIFTNAESFNQNISNWDVSGVIKNFADRSIPISKNDYQNFEETYMFGKESKFPSNFKPRILSDDGSNKGKERHCIDKIAKRYKSIENSWKYTNQDLNYYNNSLSSGNIEVINSNRANVLQSMGFVISGLGLLRWDLKDCLEAKPLADKYISQVEAKQEELVKLKEEWSKKTEIKFNIGDAILMGFEAALSAY
jgi:surface protein